MVPQAQGQYMQLRMAGIAWGSDPPPRFSLIGSLCPSLYLSSRQKELRRVCVSNMVAFVAKRTV